MSFNVFAAGSGIFHYKKDDFIDGGDFVPMKVVATLMTMDVEHPVAEVPVLLSVTKRRASPT